jgi:hypothetical protein
VHLHEAQAAFRSKDPNLFVLTRILQEAGKANKTVYAFFLTCAKRMIRSEGWAIRKLLEKGVEVMGSCET